MKKPTILRLTILLSVVMILGCTAAERVSPIENTFLEDVDVTQKRSELPFDHSWVAANVSKSGYDKIFLKPVRTDKLPEDGWKRSITYAITSKGDYDAAAERIANYFHQQLREQLSAYPNRTFTVVNIPGPRTLVVEIALTELEFSKPVARAGALVAPVPGTGAALSTVTDPHVAFAGRVTDGQTGKLVATVADRKFPPMRIVDLNKLTVESSPREVVTLWATTITQALNGDGKHPITEERFSLLPW